MKAEKNVRDALEAARRALDSLLADDPTMERIALAGKVLSRCFASGGKVLVCGNGGYLCDAMHFAEELTGNYRRKRVALPALAIADPSHITCVGNDFGYDQVFARSVEAHGRPGDVLVALSTSGKSTNVLNAAHAASAKGLEVIALTGAADTPLALLADVPIATPAGPHPDRVQEVHIKVLHILVELVERELFASHYE
jgi:D-sedoheptulose 7-phosphate isomerase